MIFIQYAYHSDIYHDGLNEVGNLLQYDICHFYQFDKFVMKIHCGDFYHHDFYHQIYTSPRAASFVINLFIRLNGVNTDKYHIGHLSQDIFRSGIRP